MGAEHGGRAYPFHTCGGWVPDGLDEFAPILLLVNGCLGEGSLRVRQGGLALRLVRCGGGGVSPSKFRNDVSLTRTLMDKHGGWKVGRLNGRGSDKGQTLACHATRLLDMPHTIGF